MLIIGISLPGFTQAEFGSVVALNSSEDELAVAADSRAFIGEGRYFDNRCKITTLGQQFIFSVTNYTGRGVFDAKSGKPLHLYWDSHTLAKREFARLSHGKHAPNNFMLQLATAWGKGVKREVEHDLIIDRSGTILGFDGQIVTSAIFAGFEHGILSIVTARITYEPLSGLKFSATIDRTLRTIVLGHDAIAQEFTANQTARAKGWNRDMRTGYSNAVDGVAFFTYQMVDLSIRYLPSSAGVGYPIDEIVLHRAGKLDWVKCKTQCRKE
jgi:hypothetical protein